MDANTQAIENNVAVLKRLRDMLSRQREKFGAYLRLLECEGQSIEQGDAEKLLAQVEMEKSLIADIFTLRKVIAPLEAIYQSSYPAGAEATVPRLNATLDAMGTEIISRNAKNRQRLRERMEELRLEITSLRAWPKASPFAAAAAPSLIDIHT
jgi:hypothetical protein